jgi:hypothetical protein
MWMADSMFVAALGVRYRTEAISPREVSITSIVSTAVKCGTGMAEEAAAAANRKPSAPEPASASGGSKLDAGLDSPLPAGR